MKWVCTTILLVSSCPNSDEVVQHDGIATIRQIFLASDFLSASRH